MADALQIVRVRPLAGDVVELGGVERCSGKQGRRRRKECCGSHFILLILAKNLRRRHFGPCLLGFGVRLRPTCEQVNQRLRPLLPLCKDDALCPMVLCNLP